MAPRGAEAQGSRQRGRPRPVQRALSRDGVRGALRAVHPLPVLRARGALARFYRGVTRAIRAGGARQVVFPEGIADSAQQPPVLPRLADRQSGFDFHFYCGQTQLSPLQVPVGAPSPEAKACAPVERRQLGRFTAYARRLGVPGFLSEFSCTDVDPDNAQVVDRIGRSFTSWTAWAYYTGADDPADCPRQGLLRDDDKPGSEANAKQAKLDALAVPYAEAIAGRPLSTSLDRAHRTYRLAYRATGVPGARLAQGARTVILVPRRMYPHGYVVHAGGARVRSRRDARRLQLTGPRGRRVSVRITARR
ncbi:MAG TPA: cellulase family glycosylhydrolase [Solirubrobacteraceae bacterium]